MQIYKIKTVKGYKSFADFRWQQFCHHSGGQEAVLQKFTIIFGENGAGKSALCDVLKSVSQNQDFQNTPPTLAEIELKDGHNKLTHKYANSNWTNQVDRNSFLFFDVDFINANVHTHGEISSNLQHGAHTQNAGKLIIELDERANILGKSIKAKQHELKALQRSCADVLGQPFTEKDKAFFETYKNTDDATKEETLSKAQEELKTLEEDLTTLQNLNNKYAEINGLSAISQVVFSNSLPTKNTISELFKRQIKEKAQDEADEKIKSHFAKHREFIEYAKDEIPEDFADENCPLCMQPLTNATRVIEYYRTAFDQTYENAKRQFLTDIETAIDALDTIKSNLNSLPQKVTAVFDDLEKIKTDFEIQDIYTLGEKTEQSGKFSDIAIKEIDDLMAALESLNMIEREQVDPTKL